MIEVLRSAKISQIHIENLISFNSDNEEESIDFCKNLGITFLPSRDKKRCYKLNKNDKFEIVELENVPKCNPNDLLFSKETLKKFGEDSDNVVFVLENDEIKGVVHIVDYNNEFIYVEFYRLFFRFEKMLRDYLRKQTMPNDANDTFLEWAENRAKKYKKEDQKKVWQDKIDNKFYTIKALKERSIFGQLQTFDLTELLIFAGSKKYFSCNSTKIADLRNWVAHSKDIVKQDKNDLLEFQSLYNFSQLEYFNECTEEFFKKYEELESKLSETSL